MSEEHKIVLRVPFGTVTHQWVLPYYLLQNCINGSRLIVRVPNESRLVPYRRIIFLRECPGIWCAHGFITTAVFQIFECATELSRQDMQRLQDALNQNLVVRNVKHRLCRDENLYRL